jgi:hypothetical protein
MMKEIIFLLGFFFIGSSAVLASDGLDQKEIEKVTGAKVEVDEKSNSYTASFPLTGLKVQSVGVKLTPTFGLECWASFVSSGEDAKVQARLVLLEDQINIVLKEALENGFKVVSLQNHSLWENPRLMVMVINGEGKLIDLATNIGKVFDIIKKSSSVLVWKAPLFINTEKSTLNIITLEEILKSKATYKKGVYDFVWGQTPTQSEKELILKMPSKVAFAGTDKMAVMYGETSIPEQNLQNLLKVFMKHNIYVTAIQNREGMGVIHFMNRGPIIDLAQGIKEVMQITTDSPQESTEEKVLGADTTLSPQEQ